MVRLRYRLTQAVQRLYDHFNLLRDVEPDWKCHVLKAVWGKTLAEM